MNKSSVGGRKFALRRLNAKDRASAEVIGIGTPPEGDHNDRPLLMQLFDHGKVVGRESLEDARKRHHDALAELPLDAHKMSRGEPVIPTIMLDEAGHPTDNPYARK
jgi:nicotinate phosphoribosyltransferase